MKNPSCRICGSSNIAPIVHYHKSPKNIERLLEPELLEKDTPVELDIYQCNLCTHVQLAEQLKNDFYEEYLMTHSHAKKMQWFQQKQAADFINHFGLKGSRVFEAGCGDGQFALTLQEMGCNVLANEPSAKARKACEKKGLKTIDGYLKREAFPEIQGTFDAIVARQVLEHVPDPNDFAAGMRNMLKPQGAGLVEVPSLEQAVENNRFFDFFPDHLSYFSKVSLVHLFSRHMFEIVKIKRAMDGEYNEIWIRKAEKPILKDIQLAADSISTAFKDFLKKEGASGRKVAIWGAGAKGVLTLSMVDTSSVVYLLDKDPVKHGRYTPVSHLQVSSPDRLLDDPVDTVIITALAYKDEICQELRNKYAFKGKIVYLSGGSILE